MKNNRCLYFTAALSLVGCSTYPPPSELPETGWRCTALDSDGNPFFYNHSDKAVAAKFALEKCQGGTPYPFSCRVDLRTCEQIK